MKNVIPFRGDEVLKYAIYRDGRDSIVESETLVEGTDELSDILTEAHYSYGIYKPSSNGYWISNNTQDGTFKSVLIKKSDGDSLNQEENDFITALLNKGVYSENEDDGYSWSGKQNFGVGGWIFGGFIGAFLGYQLGKAVGYGRAHQGYALGGSIEDTEKIQQLVKKWVYFTFNYPNDFISDIWGNSFLDSHFKGKFTGFYSTYGTDGVMPNFYNALDDTNRIHLAEYLLDNYKDYPVEGVSPEDFADVITHWNSFCFNFPYGWVQKTFKRDTNHFLTKWNKAYSDSNPSGAVNVFFTRLSGDNQDLLIDWAIKNHNKGMGKFLHGGKAQGYNDKLDESLGNTTGRKSSMEQNYKDRRDESTSMMKSEGKRKYQRVGTMDKMDKGGKLKSIMTKEEIGVVIPKTYQIGDKEFGHTYKVEAVNNKKYSANDDNRHYNFRIWEFDKDLNLFDELKHPSAKIKALERIEMSKDYYAKGGGEVGGGYDGGYDVVVYFKDGSQEVLEGGIPYSRAMNILKKQVKYSSYGNEDEIAIVVTDQSQEFDGDTIRYIKSYDENRELNKYIEDLNGLAEKEVFSYGAVVLFDLSKRKNNRENRKVYATIYGDDIDDALDNFYSSDESDGLFEADFEVDKTIDGDLTYDPQRVLNVIYDNTFADGGMTQGYNDRMDESLGMRNRGKHSQNYKDRRDEAKGMNKGMGHRAYQSVGTMDRMDNGGSIEDITTEFFKRRFDRKPESDPSYYETWKNRIASAIYFDDYSLRNNMDDESISTLKEIIAEQPNNKKFDDGGMIETPYGEIPDYRLRHISVSIGNDEEDEIYEIGFEDIESGFPSDIKKYINDFILYSVWDNYPEDYEVKLYEVVLDDGSFFDLDDLGYYESSNEYEDGGMIETPYGISEYDRIQHFTVSGTGTYEEGGDDTFLVEIYPADYQSLSIENINDSYQLEEELQNIILNEDISEVSDFHTLEDLKFEVYMGGGEFFDVEDLIILEDEDESVNMSDIEYAGGGEVDGDDIAEYLTTQKYGTDWWVGGYRFKNEEVEAYYVNIVDYAEGNKDNPYIDEDTAEMVDEIIKEQYGFGGGVLVGGAISGYLGYKLGQKNPETKNKKKGAKNKKQTKYSGDWTKIKTPKRVTKKLLQEHSQYTEEDYTYFKEKGYNNKEIYQLFERETKFEGGGAIDNSDYNEVIISLLNETGEEFEEIDDNTSGNILDITMESGAEYRVYLNEDDAYDDAVERVTQDAEENLEGFNKDFVMQHLDKDIDNFFREVYDEMNVSYANDIKLEGDDKYDNRLIEEMVMYGLMSQSDAESGEASEIAEDRIDDFVETLTSDQMTGGDGTDYYRDVFGEDELYKLLQNNNLIDIDSLSQDAVATDGIGHFISSYDGNMIYLDNGEVAFRTK